MLSHICFEREEHSTQMNEQRILEHNGHIFFAYSDGEHKCHHLLSLVFKASGLFEY